MTNKTKIITLPDSDGGVITLAVNDFIQAGLQAGLMNFHILPVVANVVGGPLPEPYFHWLTVQINYYDPAIM